jgi:hypothetical protein
MNAFEKAKIIAETFQAACVGVAALLGGLGALKVLGEWRDKRRRQREKKKWLKRFPKELLGKDFRLLRHSYSKDNNGRSHVIGSSNNVYACDERTKTRHWIANEPTLVSMGFNQEEAHGVAKEDLEAYRMGKQIDLAD